MTKRSPYRLLPSASYLSIMVMGGNGVGTIGDDDHRYGRRSTPPTTGPLKVPTQTMVLVERGRAKLGGTGNCVTPDRIIGFHPNFLVSYLFFIPHLLLWVVLCYIIVVHVIQSQHQEVVEKLERPFNHHGT
jgi:hypothetical protein